MEIRSLEKADIEVFVDDLWIPFAEEMAELDDYNALAGGVRSDAIEYRQGQLSNDEQRTLIAVSKGTFIGLLSAEITNPGAVFARGNQLSIFEVYVRPESRRQGVASALLAEIESWGNQYNCDTVSLNVNVDNYSARQFFENQGFEVKRQKLVKSQR